MPAKFEKRHVPFRVVFKSSHRRTVLMFTNFKIKFGCCNFHELDNEQIKIRLDAIQHLVRFHDLVFAIIAIISSYLYLRDGLRG